MLLLCDVSKREVSTQPKLTVLPAVDIKSERERKRERERERGGEINKGRKRATSRRTGKLTMDNRGERREILTEGGGQRVRGRGRGWEKGVVRIR